MRIINLLLQVVAEIEIYDDQGNYLETTQQIIPAKSLDEAQRLLQSFERQMNGRTTTETNNGSKEKD